MIKQIIKITGFFVIVMLTNSCKKFLDIKSDQKLSTPGTLADLEALLDEPGFYTRGTALPNTGSDEYYVPFTSWHSLQPIHKGGYIWAPELDDLGDWVNQYQNIFKANTVLDSWIRIIIDSSDQNAKYVKGSALFLRAHCFYQLAQLYAPQYDPATASSDPGIVLRLNADFNIPSQRSSVQQTYDQIINDLQEASSLLSPASAYNSRPNKASAFALLARTYLQIGDYAKAKETADNCLQIYSYLIDYNDGGEIDTSAGESIKNRNKNNKEIIFLLNETGSINSVNANAKIDSNLYRSYDVYDIRKAAFFQKNTSDDTYRFKGSYNGSLSMGAFVGIGTAEVYLIRAEANARLAKTTDALTDLNHLLKHRYISGRFNDILPTTQEEAIDIILAERKKEMVYRGMRWADLKRLNKESRHKITVKRVLNGQEYTLPPNDNRYTLLIPREVMKETDLQQNPR